MSTTKLLDSKTFGPSLQERRELAKFLPWLKRYYSNVSYKIELNNLPDGSTVVNVIDTKGENGNAMAPS
jgi:hypothetical protein